MKGTIFDTKKAAREMRIPKEEYEKLETEIKADFPRDEMMFELHFLRALKNLFLERKALPKELE